MNSQDTKKVNTTVASGSTPNTHPTTAKPIVEPKAAPHQPKAVPMADPKGAPTAKPKEEPTIAPKKL